MRECRHRVPSLNCVANLTMKRLECPLSGVKLASADRKGRSGLKALKCPKVGE